MRSAAALLAGVIACSFGDPMPLTSMSGEWVDPHTGIVFVRIPAGRFVMGAPASERYREASEVQHDVTISRPFLLGKYEVTQQEWVRVMGTRPSAFDGAARDLPVENVTWFEVQAFLKQLSGGSDRRFRLPTEAEWEYACRAGTATPYGVGALLTPGQANIDRRDPRDHSPEIAGGGTVGVGTFAPNAWGLHDMHGNVWEWTDDRFCPYGVGDRVDPRGSCDDPRYVIRGGSWYFRADSARCAQRYTHRPQDRGFSLGFRVARDVHPGD